MGANERGRTLRLDVWGKLRLSPRMRQALQSAALAVGIAGLAVAAIELSRWHPHADRFAAAASAHGSGTPSPSFGHDQRLVAVAPEPASSAGLPSGARLPTRAASGAPSSSVSLPPMAPQTKFRSASELFADANGARERGDRQAALAVCRVLEETFPNSREGIAGHLFLGVLHLQLGEPDLALQELKIYRHIGPIEAMAEALWAEDQAYQKLGRPSDERPVLEELLQNYPHSAYTAAAEQRLAALNHP